MFFAKDRILTVRKMILSAPDAKKAEADVANFNNRIADTSDGKRRKELEAGLMQLAKEGQLSVYKHEGFWKAMDTYREMEEMNELWNQTKPWAIWEHK